jgi:hypothetical protein
MWRLSFMFFIGMFTAATLTNAISVYLLHDVDADLTGKWNQAYWNLTIEFFFFAVVVAALFLTVTWVGTLILHLRDTPANSRLVMVLGIALILFQYPAEFAVRKLSASHSADTFLLAYLVLSPVACSTIVLIRRYRSIGGVKTDLHHPTRKFPVV